MKTGIIAFAIAVVLLMVTVQTAVADEPFTAVGHVVFEDGTQVPDDWTVEVWNLDQVYGAEPWTTVTRWVPPSYEYGVTCEYNNANDNIRVLVTSTDGTYVGENISRWGDVYIGPSEKTCMNVTVYLQSENFTKSLPLGWNLISLPLAPLDNGTSAVLGNDSIVYNAVKQYNAATHQFEDATAMDPGTGYFVHVTTEGDWTYEGTAVDSTSTGLKAGLNMIGVLNCTKTVSDTMSSIVGNYRYVARWNTTATPHKFEVYNPNAPSAFHHFDTMTAGEGYFVSAKTDCTLIVNCTG